MKLMFSVGRACASEISVECNTVLSRYIIEMYLSQE